MIDFINIEYLRYGTDKQIKSYKILKNYRILEILSYFNPILTGTIPINIDIDNSDLDIICNLKDKNLFVKLINDNFKDFNEFKISEKKIQNLDTILINFYADDMPVEIFAQPLDTLEQYSYKHMIVEYLILNKYGESFRKEIISLKNQGYKTEPAFAKLLNIEGDPHTELLNISLNL